MRKQDGLNEAFRTFNRRDTSRLGAGVQESMSTSLPDAFNTSVGILLNWILHLGLEGVPVYHQHSGIHLRSNVLALCVCLSLSLSLCVKRLSLHPSVSLSACLTLPERRGERCRNGGYIT